MQLGLLLFMLVVDLEFSDDKHNFVPYMCEVIITYVPIEDGVVESYINGFPD